MRQNPFRFRLLIGRPRWAEIAGLSIPTPSKAIPGSKLRSTCDC